MSLNWAPSKLILISPSAGGDHWFRERWWLLKCVAASKLACWKASKAWVAVGATWASGNFFGEVRTWFLRCQIVHITDANSSGFLSSLSVYRSTSWMEENAFICLNEKVGKEPHTCVSYAQPQSAWKTDLVSCLHSSQTSSLIMCLRFRFCFTGKALWQVLQRKFRTLLCTLRLQINFHTSFLGCTRLSCGIGAWSAVRNLVPDLTV